jgi:hypothetical protein
MIPVSVLFYTQVGNFMNGMTTNERFSKINFAAEDEEDKKQNDMADDWENSTQPITMKSL